MDFRNKQKHRGAWKTRLGFYLAAIGSAFGLGNLWRFPYVVGENGGGAFVLLYVLLALLIGMPLLIGELMLGKLTRQSIVSASTSLNPKFKKYFAIISRSSIALSLFILAYYAVISGWVLHFLTQFIIGMFDPGILNQKAHMSVLSKNGWLQMALASVHLMITVVIVLRGVQEGLEKWIGSVMPLFGVLLFLLLLKSLSLDTSQEAIRFLFYPDFSKLTLSSLGHAIGHVCFTLSVGFGTMVTFGSYMGDQDHVPTAGFRVAVIDTVLSLVAASLIFPLAFQGIQSPVTDPALLFETLPQFFMNMKVGIYFGIVFFSCLYLAALGASIGLLETIVSNFVDRKNAVRSNAAWLSGFIALFLSTIPALSGSFFKSVKFFNKSLLELLDAILINWCLPLIALAMSLMIIKGISAKDQKKMFIDDNKIESVILYPHWVKVMTWVVTVVIAIAMILQVAHLFV